MPLNDCPGITSFLPVEPSLTLDNVTFGSGATSQLQADGVNTLNIPTLEAFWDLPESPYVLGIEFQYQRAGGAVLHSAVQSALNVYWHTSDGILTNSTYSCRWRAVGEGKVGLWSDPAVDVLITGAFGLAGPDGILTEDDLVIFLKTIPLNLATFAEYVPQTGAVAVGVPPADPYIVFGESLQAIEITGGAPGIKIIRTGTAGLASDGYGYAHSFWARTSDVGGSTLRVGFRRVIGGTPFAGLADKVYALTTAWTEFTWSPIASNVAGWDAPAQMRFFDNAGDIDAGETVSITDLAMYQGPTLGAGLQAIWRPSYNEVALKRQAGLLEQLFNAELLAHPNMRLSTSPDGLGHRYLPIGVRGVRTITGTADTVTAADAGGYLRTTNAAAVAVTIPAGLWTTITKAGALPGCVISVSQRAAGLVTIVAGVGVTITPKLGGTLISAGNGDVMQLLATDVADVFDLI